MARILGVLFLVFVMVGCTGSSSTADVERLEAEVEVLEIQLEASEETVQTQREELEDARRVADAVVTTDGDGECLEKLARCEELVFDDEGEEWPPPSPDVWFPPTSAFATNEASIIIAVFAAQSASVTANDLAAEPSSDAFTGGNAVFSVAVSLREGVNSIDVAVDGRIIASLEVVFDERLVRRYGRVLDSRATIMPPGSTDAGLEEDCGSGEENACVLYELGIDFGDMDLEPDYGMGDFEAGDVVVEFKRLTPSTIAPITTHAGNDQLLVGAGEIWEFFGWGDTTHFDVWNVLLDGDTITQIEGIVPLGD